jgi:hypothetical protein
LSSGGTDIGSWEVVAHGSVILPSLCEGLVIGKIIKKKKLESPREIVVEPKKSGTSGNLNRKELNIVKASGDDRAMSLQNSPNSTVSYCVLKVLNTSGGQFELGKHVKLGNAEPLLQVRITISGCEPREQGSMGNVEQCR